MFGKMLRNLLRTKETLVQDALSDSPIQGEPMKKSNLQFYQGDVAILKVPEMIGNVKEVPRDNGRVILAYGEVTGHAHALYGNRVALFRDDSIGRTFLKVEEPDTLKHEEHAPIDLPEGIYEIRQQREYDDETRRAQWVAD